MICLATWHVQSLFRVNVGIELVNELKIKMYGIAKIKQTCPSRGEKK